MFLVQKIYIFVLLISDYT